MRRSNYDLSTALVGIGAVAVLVSLFLDWYEPGLNAFDVFELTDWLLVALAIGALVVIATESFSGSSGAPTNRLAWICGLLAFVIVAQLLDPPPAARGADRDIGAWLALAGAALMVGGAVLALLQISVTIDVTERERRQRMAAVDARAEDGDAAPSPGPSGPGGASGLWQAPSAGTPEAAEAPTTVSDVPDPPPAPPKPKRPARPKPPAQSTAASPDPERTQPLKPSDRPDGDDAS